MERTIEVRTGESVAIRYELAGLGSRFIAVAIDVAIQVVFTVASIVLIGLLSVPIARALGALDLQAKPVVVLGWSLVTIALFLVYFGYFIIFELAWSGRTPGKRLVGLRVVRDAGFPIDIGAAVIRNVVRIVELALLFYAVSAVVALVSKENKRLGDFAAGTLVVRDRRYEAVDLEAYLARDAAPDDGLSPADRTLVERFIARRAQLAPDARRALAAQIAARVRAHLREPAGDLGDEALLERLGNGSGVARR